MKKFLKRKCHDCEAKEGELHGLGCDMERCPFCGGQLLSCSCCYTKLGYKYDPTKEFSGLPKSVYFEGLSENNDKKWMMILNKKGRIPYIIVPVFCARCLKPYPEMFMDDEWKKSVPIGLRNKVLCRPCYKQIKKWMEMT